MNQRDDGPPDHKLEQHLAAMGLRLRAARRRADLTQGELAALSGVDRGNISRAEHGGNISLETLWRLAIALDMHAADLVDDRLRGDG
ncbi:helix-turn-helix domain-containing protein [Amycolatopsis sp. CA-128772]|uniref:helix-turn-helix domain-containing protein n=1 Tax=Amycolatopsis sp. CA-128772 TaxID=2073159 RepID=UPI000CD0E19A|nr:helix-turn-helix transcriptional regulator [Amycolatopsis sp. CA-128772]